jgi:glucosamine-6-phosphate deaminase
MKIIVCKDKKELGKKAARDGARLVRAAIQEKGSASIIFATGASQFDMLEALVQEKGILWNKVSVFHLDEYVGLPVTHPATFRLFLWQRIISKLPLPVAAFHQIDGEADPEAECRRLSRIIAKNPVDVAFIGIGENGHLAFNDPPADFKTTRPYIVAIPDEACRKQQMGEGWFRRISDVPEKAISMSIRQIMKSRAIICSVPDKRKAEAAKACLKGPVTPDAPGSILQQHGQAMIYLDPDSASLLK